MGATNLFLDSILLESFYINGKVFISFRECSEKEKKLAKKSKKTDLNHHDIQLNIYIYIYM